MVTIQSAESALKTVYLDVVAEQLNTSVNPFLAKIQKTSKDVWGKEVRKLAPYGINGGIGAGDEDGELPLAHSNRYVQFVSTLKNLFGQIEITDKAIRASQDSSGAFVNLLNSEMQGLLNASTYNLGRMLFGDGSGKLCAVASLSGADMVVGDVRNLIEGMVVDVMSSDGDSQKDCGLRIEAVDRDAKTVTLSRIPTASNGDILVVQGSAGKELTGLGAIFSDSGTLYGVDKAKHKWMRPYVANMNGALSEIAIQSAIDRLDEYNGSKVDFIICSNGVKRAYQKMMCEYKRNIDMMEIDGGYKVLTYNGIPLVSDRFVPEGTMYLLNSKDFCLHQLCDWKWLENESGRILHQKQGRASYTATLVKYAELICDRPAGQAMLTGIKEM